ncbi:hypothetical protein TNCV_3543061 [Trichonephila clavipes]|nr:hypothetical protein TNCV_3543061 [Trichonephila clavipes]
MIEEDDSIQLKRVSEPHCSLSLEGYYSGSIKHSCGEGYASVVGETALRYVLRKVSQRLRALVVDSYIAGTHSYREILLASTLDRARQHVMGVSPLSNFEESSVGYTWHVGKVWDFVAWRESMLPKKRRQLKRIDIWSRKPFASSAKKKLSPTWADSVEFSTLSAGGLHFTNSSPIKKHNKNCF